MKKKDIDEIIKRIRDEKPECEVLYRQTVKNNNVLKDSIIITEKQGVPAPVIYLADNDDIDVEIETNRIIQAYEMAVNEAPAVDISRFADFDWIKDKLLFQIVGRSRNEESTPHVNVTPDLMAVFRVYISPGASILVSRDNMDMWNVNEAEMFEIALENSETVDKATFKSIEDVLFDVIGGMEATEEQRDFVESLAEVKKTGGSNMYVLTTGMQDGRCLLYSNVLPEIEKRLGPVYVLPSSIHEWIIIPEECVRMAGMKIADLKQMVREINITEVADIEVLSDEILHYDRETGLQQVNENDERDESRC